MYQDRRYLFLTAVLPVSMFFFYPWVQTLGLQTDLWYQIIPVPNLILFLALAIVFGIFVSFQIKQFKEPKVCTIKQVGKRSTFEAIGTAFGFFVGVRPACIGFAGLLLPLAAVTILVVFGLIFILVGIGLMLESSPEQGI